MVTDNDFHTLIATLQRALDLRLTKSQRTKLKALCQEIAGVEAESGIPPRRLGVEVSIALVRTFSATPLASSCSHNSHEISNRPG